MSSGYWTVFDPTNGYTPISANLASNFVGETIHAVGITKAYLGRDCCL
jgi:hypothetical protein